MGTVESSFDKNWINRKEALYNHWTRGWPKNQIQLAFRRHWITFQRYLKDVPVNKVLEVGCGRGSISSYFADAGYESTLLDSSPKVIEIAKEIFSNNGHSAQYIVGDAFAIDLPDESQGVCVSIGLFEHFDNVEGLFLEQLRVLVPGGVLLAYIVPERPDNVQRHYRWLNALLKGIARLGGGGRDGAAPQKEEVYRNELDSNAYREILVKNGVSDIEAFGMYPLPMVSHSPEFPFSLLPKPVERVLVGIFSLVLGIRKTIYRKDPWTCREELGQAFLVMARKP